MKKTLIEDCPSLSITNFKASLKVLGGGSSGVDGQIELNHCSQPVPVDYWLEKVEDELSLTISLTGEPQRFELVPLGLTFGTRFYLVCDCGRRVNKLYLPSDQTNFKCRHCHNLAYELTRINKHSSFGKLLYQSCRLDKLFYGPTNAIRMFYRGNFTKNFNRQLNLYRKLGLGDFEVAEAKKLLSLVQSVNQ